jgi:hexulose-6-phosphate isomerase
MQINYWTIGGFEGAKPPQQALAEAKDMGFEGVELCFGAGEFAGGISREKCLLIRNAAKKIGMKIETMASGSFWTQSFSSPDAAERAKAIEFTKEYLTVASWIGAKVVLVIPGAVAVPWDSSRPVVHYAAVWQRATEGIKKCLPVAKKCGVAIGIENVWNWFLTDPAAYRAFIDQFDSPLVGAYFDVANCLING